jgi:hypothetical protein
VHFQVKVLPAFLVLALCLATIGPVHAARVDREIKLSDGAEVSIETYPAAGERLLLWLYNQHGRPSTADKLSTATAALGLEVWAADLVLANFLPAARSSLEQIPGEQVLDLVRAAHKATGKTVYLYAGGRAAVTAVRGALVVQAAAAPDRAALGGLVFMSPNLYVKVPEPGTDAEYLPEVSRVAQPVYHFQPQLSPWFWYRDRLKSRLEQGGSTVTVHVLPKVRGRFEFRPDAWPLEEAMAAELPAMLRDAVEKLSTMKGAAQ